MGTSTARFVICTNCHFQFYICSQCDRGNIYCGSTCATIARKKHDKNASQRYQNTLNGKICHALRQKRYRARQQNLKNKVTHQGSQTPPNCVPLSAHLLKMPTQHQTPDNFTQIYCNFCGKICSKYVRQNFLTKKRKIPLNSQGP
jgi:hypothetical protein